MGLKIQQGQIGNAASTMPVFTGQTHGNSVSCLHDHEMVKCKGKADCPFYCCPCHSDNAIQSLGLPELLEFYCKHYRPLMWQYFSLYREISFDQCLVAAAMAYCPRSPARKHPHQWRIPRVALEKFSQNLLEYAHELRDAVDFGQLLCMVTKAKIPKIGKLTCYDTALRIGAHLNKLPEHTVYLHAKACIPGSQKDTVERDQLHEAFSKCQMTAYEIEDFLCRFHKILERERVLFTRIQK